MFLDYVASLYIRQNTLLIGFAGVSLRSGRVAISRGGEYFLDRACPYLPFQIHHNSIEADRCGLKKPKISPLLLNRCLQEYDESSTIKLPSKYSLSSYPIEYEKKLSLYRLNVKEISVDSNSNLKESFVIGIIATDFIRKGLRTGFIILEKILLSDDSIKINLKMTKRLCLSTKNSRNFYSRFSHRILFTGYVNDISDYYSTLDLLLVPSNDEGFGMVVFEALQGGVPVVVSKYVGAGDYIQSSDYSFCMENDNIDVNIDLLRKLIVRLKESPRSEIMADCRRLYSNYNETKLSYV